METASPALRCLKRNRQSWRVRDAQSSGGRFLEVSLLFWARTYLGDVKEMLPCLRFVYRLRHQIGNLLFSVDVQQFHTRIGANLDQPMNVDPVCARQMPQGHGAALCYDLDNGPIISGDNEDSCLRNLLSEREVPAWVETF